jgi:hypothetical protein
MDLAAVMLFSGFKRVVATMWHVDRESRISECPLKIIRAISGSDDPNVTQWFYDGLLTEEVMDGDSIVCARKSTVSELHASGVPPEHWAPFIYMGA